MFDGCVDKNSQGFKDLCKTYRVASSHMELIIHSWWRTHEDGSMPSDNFIKNYMNGERVEMSDKDISHAVSNGLFEPKEFDDRQLAENYYKWMAKMYPKRAIGSYTREDGKIVISLAKPIIGESAKLKNYNKPKIGGTITIGEGPKRTITKVNYDGRAFNIDSEGAAGVQIFIDSNTGEYYTLKRGEANNSKIPVKLEGTESFYSEYEDNSTSKVENKQSTEQLAKKVASEGITAQYGVVVDHNLKANNSLWQTNNPNGIVAYRVNWNNYNSSTEAKEGRIGNPFSENARGQTTVEQFFTWLVTGENFGNAKATEEYRQAIIEKLLATPEGSPVLYYTELQRPSHATVIGYLINNKELLRGQSNNNSNITKESINTPEGRVAAAKLPKKDRLLDVYYMGVEDDSPIFHISNKAGTDTLDIYYNFTRNKWEIRGPKLSAEKQQSLIDTYIPKDLQEYFSSGGAARDKGLTRKNMMDIPSGGASLEEMWAPNSVWMQADTFGKVLRDNWGIHSFTREGYNNFVPEKTNNNVKKSPKTIDVWSSNKETGHLSNFADRPFIYGSTRFSSVESAFQAGKFEFLANCVRNAFVGATNDEDILAEVRDVIKLAGELKMQAWNAANGSAAKAIGQKRIKSNNKTVQEVIDRFFNVVWEERKVQFCKNLMKASFEQNPQAKQALLDTGDAILTHKAGRNGWDTLFPRLLTEIREEFKQSPQESQPNTPAPSIQVSAAERDRILAEAKRDSEGNLLAPNGRVSNLSEDNYVLVRTQAFKDWFGDWLNDPTHASQVVDENGEPLLVYHGTSAQFDKFDIQKAGETTGLTEYTDPTTGEKFISDSKDSIFFSSSLGVAAQYGMLGVYNSIQRTYNKVQSLIGTILEGTIEKDYFSSGEELDDFFESLGKYNPRFIALANIRRKYRKEGKKLSQGEREAIRSMLLDVRTQLKEFRDWTVTLAASWFNVLTRAQAILKKYNTEEGIQRLLNGEVPSEVLAEWYSYNHLKGTDEEWSTYMGWNPSITSHMSAFEYTKKDGLYIVTGDNNSKRYKVTELSKEKLKEILNSLANEVNQGIVRYNAETNFATMREGANVLSAFLNIRNPFEHDYEGTKMGGGYKNNEKYPFGYVAARQRKRANERGNDGMIYRNIADPYLADNYAAFNENQVIVVDKKEPQLSENDTTVLEKLEKEFEEKRTEAKKVETETLEVLGGTADSNALSEFNDVIKTAKEGITFEEALKGVESIFTQEEIDQIKSAIPHMQDKKGGNKGKLQVMSVSRQTDPVFFANEIIKFLERNSKKPFTDPTRVNAIEIWTKHDGEPIQDILEACKKYKVAPMVSFSITGLGNTALEKGVMTYNDLLDRIGQLIEVGALNPITTTVRIDPILVGETKLEDIKAIVERAKSLGIKKFVTSLVQSYGYMDGTSRDRKVTSGINKAMAEDGRTYDWDKYYGRDSQGKIAFKPKKEYIKEVADFLIDLNKDPEIEIETCAFPVRGLKNSACLDPLILERVTGIDVTAEDGSYDKDTSRPDCMCYSAHSDMFKMNEKTCASSCAYCYAAHSGDNNLNYYNEDGTLKDNPFTRVRIQQQSQINEQMEPTNNNQLSKEDQEYIDKDVALDAGLTALTTSGVITASEVNEVASSVVNSISDEITAIQAGDTAKLERYQKELENVNISTASRVEIITAIGLPKLLENCKEDFKKSLQENGMSLRETMQFQVINKNWDALIYMAQSIFMENEKISIVNNGDGDMTISEDINKDADNFNESKKEDEIQETGSNQENWQVEARTRDIIQNATAIIRDALRQCYQLDSNGNPIKGKFGTKVRVDVHDAVNSILRWTQGAQDIDDMIAMLKDKENSNKWIGQIITRLEDNSGKEADFQSQFFVTFCQREQLYGVVTAEKDKDGNVKFSTKIVNKSPALKDAYSSIANQFKIGEHPLFTGRGINETAFAQLDETKAELVDSSWEDDDVVKNLTHAFHTLGYYVAEEDVEAAIQKEEDYNKMVEALEYIVDTLYEHINDKDYNPFTYSRDKNAGSIYTNLRNMLRPITERLEDTAISSFYNDGKMYQTYTLPSYMTNLLAKFRTKDKTKFEEFIKEQYGSSEWFYDREAGWKCPWLKRFMDDDKAREIFDHKVQLSFNRQAYLTEMGDLQYTLSIISEYFSDAVNQGATEGTAWYRVPMLSNKGSSEFIKFYKYVGTRYKDTIALEMTDMMFQEIARIRTVNIRNKKKGDPGFRKNWDTRGKEFNLLTFLNKYLKEDAGDKSFRDLLQRATSEEGISEKETIALTKKAQEIIKKEMQAKADSILKQYKEDGIIEACDKVKNIGRSEEEILENLENFIWNDAFAAMNILELTITDPANYDGAVDLQKRFAQIHAPGSRPNVKATDYGDGTPNSAKLVADRYSRTIIIDDFKGLKSNIIENLEIVFNRKIAESEGPEKELYKKMKESIIKDFEDINLTDAQAYNSPTSYRKKAILFGRWSREKEEIYQKLMKGEYKIPDLQKAFGEVLKPFVYTQTVESVGVEGTPIQNMPVPFQNKNSEYLLIMADAILRGENTGKPNLLRAIFEVMEKSAEDNPTKGIDTIQFDSAVKSGLHDSVSLAEFKDRPNGETLAREHLLNSIYKADSQGGRSLEYRESVRCIDWMDYGIQQEVPDHFFEHDQSHGSQIRAITISELTPGIRLKIEGKEVSAEEFAKEYEETIAANIRESIAEIERDFNLSGTTKERNIAIAKILKREMSKSPRYGIELKQACLLDKEGNFNIPLGDPIQAKRIEQLLNSVIKNTVNKQEIAGGPVVQVSNFGTSQRLNIKFKDKDGNLLMTEKEFEGSSEKDKYSSYKEYKEKNQGGIAYFECYAPIYNEDIFRKFMKADGTIDIETIELVNPELLKMVGYRIPTEDKYSCAPLKIVGFLPKWAGDGIMLPEEITKISGSDFDVDKMYVMLKEYYIEERVKAKEGETLSEAEEDYIKHNRDSIKKSLINAINLEGKLNSTERKALQERLDKEYKKAKENIEKKHQDRLNKIETRFAYLDELTDTSKYSDKDKDKIDDKTQKQYDRVIAKENKRYQEELDQLEGDRDNKYLEEAKKIERTKVLKRIDEFLSIDKHLPARFDDALTREIRKAYLDYMYKVVEPEKNSRTWRNNKIVDMTYEVLTHEDSADKILNPGGFEPQKRMGYMVAARKATGKSWAELEAMSTNELKDLSSSDMNLAFIDTHVQFYKQNSAAAALIGIFAVHKVSHAFIERDPLYIDFAGATKSKVPIKIGNTVLSGLVKIDPTKDNNQALIGKSLGSLVASAADAAKDPVLNLMNINKDTANILTTAIRLGVPFDDAALLLSQNCMSEILSELNQRRLANKPASLKGVVSDRINTLKVEMQMSAKGATDKLLGEGLSKEQLIEGLTSADVRLEMKALSYIQALLNINDELKGITLATKQNSISNAAGPLIVDNLIMRDKMSSFSKHIRIYNKNADKYSKIININSIFSLHPILNEFRKGYSLAASIMRDMPLYSDNFLSIIDLLDVTGTTSIIADRQNLSKFADFYTSYLLVNNGVIDPSEGEYYINNFPKEFFYEGKYKDKYKGNPLIDAMKLGIDPKTGIASIKVDITGLSNKQKDKLTAGFIDLFSKDKELAIKLFKYNFFKGGLGFTPKTFMSLTPLILRRGIEGYTDSFLNISTNADPSEVIDLFIRNNWNDSDFVKYLSPSNKKTVNGETKEVSSFMLNDDGSLTVTDKDLFDSYNKQGYIRTKVGNENKLYKRIYVNDKSRTLIYKEISPLGGNNQYLEFTDSPMNIDYILADNFVTKEADLTKGEEREDDPHTTTDNKPDMTLIELSLEAAGLTNAQAKAKIAERLSKPKAERQADRQQIKEFLRKQFEKMNLHLSEEQLDKETDKLC